MMCIIFVNANKHTGKKRVETSMYISNKLGIIQQFCPTFHKIQINPHRLNLIDISSYVSTNVEVRPELSLAMKVFLVFGPGG